MPGWSVLAIAAGLGADAMSVCIGIGVRWHGRRQKFRLAWHMGLFQALMPVIGYLAGMQLAGVLRDYGSYVAAGLILLVGVKMLYEALREHPGSTAEHVAEWEQRTFQLKDPTRGWSLIGLSVATSLDALVVGVSLGLEGREIWLTSLVIGLVAGGMALAGVFIGQRAGRAFGKPAEVVGALVLIALSVTLVLW